MMKRPQLYIETIQWRGCFQFYKNSDNKV